MADTLRQRIVDAVIARLEGISTDDDYETDAGERVEDWPRRFDETELAETASGVILGVCDLTEETDRDDPEAQQTIQHLPLQVRIFASSETPARTLRKVIGDVITAIRSDLTWGGLAMDTKPVRNGFIIPGEGLEIAGACVEVEITYITETFNPYQ